MKSKVFNLDKKQKNFHKIHYCGVCKTIALSYGQKARFVLNSDIVFLIELLNLISSTTDYYFHFANSFHSNNCLIFLKSKNEIPNSFKYASAINILLSELTIEDHIIDYNLLTWKLIKQLLLKSFKKAKLQLEKMNFPINQIWKLANLQSEAEKYIIKNQSKLTSNEILNYVSRPTAKITSLVFEHGAKLSVTNKQMIQIMSKLGFSFGELAYLIDAYKDYEKDSKKSIFNAWKLALNLSNERLTESIVKEILIKLKPLQNNVETLLTKLPISANLMEYYINCLRLNLYHLFSRVVNIQYPFEYISKTKITFLNSSTCVYQAHGLHYKKCSTKNEISNYKESNPFKHTLRTIIRLAFSEYL